MWLYVHGIAAMIATSYLNWDDAFISGALTDAYVGLKYRYSEKGIAAFCHVLLQVILVQAVCGEQNLLLDFFHVFKQAETTAFDCADQAELRAQRRGGLPIPSGNVAVCSWHCSHDAGLLPCF